MDKYRLLRHPEYLVAFISVITVFHVVYGVEAIVPTNINWLMSAYHDWGQHYLGWAFYRNDPWTLPLTNIQSYYYPLGTNAAFTDSIPLLALFFKIFSGILPEDFQYIGLWLFLCYCLLAYYIIKILNLYKVKPLFIMLAVIVIIANPVLTFRGMHPSLCAHWLILASLYNYLKPATKDNASAINKNQVLLFILTASINPYLAAMIAGFNVIVPLKHYVYDKALKIKYLFIFPATALVSGLIVWFAFGLISFEDKTNLDVGNIYGLYALNLNSLINSYGHYSKFLPDMGWVDDKQHEGFAYLGLGVILLSAITVVYVLAAAVMQKTTFIRSKFSLLPLIVLLLILSVFAISTKVTWNEDVLFTYKTFYFIERLGSIFRATGRFIWPAYYLLMLFSVIIFTKIKFNEWLKTAALIFFTVLQVYDVEPILTNRNLKSGPFDTKLNDEEWISIFSNFREIITYPPHTNNLGYPMDYQDLLFLSLKAGKPITNGYVNREKSAQAQAYKDSLFTSLTNGVIKEDQLFVTTKKHLDDFKVLVHNNAIDILSIDNYIMIYSKTKNLKAGKESVEGAKVLDSLMNSHTSRFVLLDDKPQENKEILFSLEKFISNGDVLSVGGWAFNNKKKDNNGDEIFIGLSAQNKMYIFPTEIVNRNDIAEVYKKPIVNPGFTITAFTNKLPKDDYEVNIVIKDRLGKMSYVKTSKSIGKVKTVTVKKMEKLPLENKDISGNLEKVEIKGDGLEVSGWAAVNKANSNHSTLQFVIYANKNVYAYTTELVTRKDVTEYKSDGSNYDDSGFYLSVRKSQLPKGEFKTGILIVDKKTGESKFKSFEKIIKL